MTNETIDPATGQVHLLPERDKAACAAWCAYTRGADMRTNRPMWLIHSMTYRGFGAMVPTYWPPGYQPASQGRR